MNATESHLDIFRQMHHVCIIVEDLDRAVEYYESLGVGPWRAMRIPTLESSTLSDEGLGTLSYRVADLDNIQLQLCHPSPGGTPQRRFLEERGHGVYHLGFSVPDTRQAEDAAVAQGLEVRANGYLEGGHGFSYLETESRAGVVLEIRSDWAK